MHIARPEKLMVSRGLFLSSAKFYKCGSFCSSPFSTIRPRFFSASRKAWLLADKNLNRWIQAKITTRETISVPVDFPFEIVDSSCHKTINLKRRFFDENIDVEAYVYDTDFYEEDDEDGCVDDAYNPLIASYSIDIHKGKDQYLEILCSSKSKGLVVETMLLKSYPVLKNTDSTNNQENTDSTKFEGPPYGFSILEETLKKSAVKYLEARGIDGTFMKLVDKWAMCRNKEHCDWLKDMKNFISK